MRSGWKRSNSSSFSPVEAYMIGLPVTALTDSAAPPRASPSSLVITTPSNWTDLGELLGHVDRVLAGHGVDDEQDVVGLDPLLRCRPARASAPRRRAGARWCRRSGRPCRRPFGPLARPGGDLDRVPVGALLVDGRRPPARRPSRAGRRPPDGRRRRRRGRRSEPCSLRRWRASLAAAVVLPEPWRPASRIDGRRARREGDVAPGAAHQRRQLLVDDLDHLLAGVERGRRRPRPGSAPSRWS